MSVVLRDKDIKKVRDEILKEQGNICPVSKKEIINPVLDHFHKRKLGGDGKIRGVLERSINIFLGKIENSCKRYGVSLEELPDVLRNIADYIQKERYDLIHPSERPIFMEEYREICEYFLIVYPKKRKVPEYPKNGLMTKEFKKYLKDIKGYKNEKDKKERKASTRNKTKIQSS